MNIPGSIQLADCAEIADAMLDSEGSYAVQVVKRDGVLLYTDFVNVSLYKRSYLRGLDGATLDEIDFGLSTFTVAFPDGLRKEISFEALTEADSQVYFDNPELADKYAAYVRLANAKTEEKE